MDQLLRESEKIQSQGRGNPPQGAGDRHPDGRVAMEPQIADILTGYDRDELELENYVQKRLQ